MLLVFQYHSVCYSEQCALSHCPTALHLLVACFPQFLCILGLHSSESADEQSEVVSPGKPEISWYYLCPLVIIPDHFSKKTPQTSWTQCVQPYVRKQYVCLSLCSSHRWASASSWLSTQIAANCWCSEDQKIVYSDYWWWHYFALSTCCIRADACQWVGGHVKHCSTNSWLWTIFKLNTCRQSS